MQRRRFAGEDHLVIVQHDGTLALVPCWMSEETAGAATLTSHPRLSVDRLLELRARVDALLASSGGESALRSGGTHAITRQAAARTVRGGSQNGGHSRRAAEHSPPAPRAPTRRGCNRSRRREEKRRQMRGDGDRT